MIKRLFFGIEAHAPWPSEYPRGRIIDSTHRHMTLAFLGNVDDNKVFNLLSELPRPTFKVGMTGTFDHPLFLPSLPRPPRVVAWHVQLENTSESLQNYQQTIVSFLQQNDFEIDSRPFLPHVTISRAPFYPREWKHAFVQLPCFFKNIILYESIGHLQYEPRWSHALITPFEEIEHTADIAFRIYGESVQQLFRHAQTALAFRFPQLITYFPEGTPEMQTVYDIVFALNEIVCKADAEMGCPFKAVSFHGDLHQEPEGTLSWEMIVDV